LDQPRTHLLLTELESSQKSLTYQITSQDRRLISSQKKERRNNNFGSYFALGIAVKFVDTDSGLIKLLCLNKASHIAIQSHVYRQALLVSQPEKLQQKRIGIWTSILGIRKNTADYRDLLQKVEENPELISNVQEVISLDVQRSEHQMPGVDAKVLVRILRTYALYNPEIEYC
jgi:hypothetical protein